MLRQRNIFTYGQVISDSAWNTGILNFKTKEHEKKNFSKIIKKRKKPRNTCKFFVLALLFPHFILFCKKMKPTKSASKPRNSLLLLLLLLPQCIFDNHVMEDVGISLKTGSVRVEQSHVAT